jgi:hypothetical protein
MCIERRVKMTIEFGTTVPDHVLKYLMIDAVAEFRKHRSPPGEYVAKRYPENLGDTDWIVAKTMQVRKRIEESEKILHGVHDMTIEEIQQPESP